MRQAAAEELARRTSAEATIRARDEFLSLAAHELKTPLTSIRGYIDLFTRRLIRDGNLATRDQQTLSVITQQVDRLGSLVSVLLDLSRLEMGQFVLEQRHIDMIPLIRRVADTAQGGSKQHDLDLQMPNEPLVVWGDELRLEQVLHNLLSNAIKYSPAGGTVTVSAQRQDDQICIFVRDQGIGIPEAGREHIFQRFYRAGNVGDGYYSGLGIGLYVVKQLVVQHGGDVDVVSQEGQGSTFIVYLPVSNPQSRPVNDPSTRSALVGSE
jgi:signal transduction histidine kinase